MCINTTAAPTYIRNVPAFQFDYCCCLLRFGAPLFNKPFVWPAYRTFSGSLRRPQNPWQTYQIFL